MLNEFINSLERYDEMIFYIVGMVDDIIKVHISVNPDTLGIHHNISIATIVIRSVHCELVQQTDGVDIGIKSINDYSLKSRESLFKD